MERGPRRWLVGRLLSTCPSRIRLYRDGPEAEFAEMGRREGYPGHADGPRHGGNPMPVKIMEVGSDMLPLYGTVPIAFRVESVLQVHEADGGMGGLMLREEPVAVPYVKDYDVYETPAGWAEHFDVSNWAFFIAFDEGRAVGAATVAFDTLGVNFLEGRTDVAGLWDIRVHPGRRGEGIGTALFERAADWAHRRGCRELKIETQDTNVRACRFYAARGCRLGAIMRRAYREPDIAHETMLLWYLDLQA